MENKRVTASLALIVLICFFLPWLQVSCGASVDRLSGVDLARDGHSALWLIPVLMLVVVFLCLARSWKERRGISAVATLVAGLVSVYLMNRERGRFHASCSTWRCATSRRNGPCRCTTGKPRSTALPSSTKTGCRLNSRRLTKMKLPGKNPGYGNRGKTNYVFPPFPQPLLLLTN
jgi:hypothetical protein